MKRNLATIQKITNIRPIPNADNLLVCNIKGWECVINKKDNFKENDLVIYIEIDSVLTATPQFEFMEKYKYRVKTQKLRGQISQGLVLPIESTLGTPMNYKIGDDVTEDLGITKYLSPSEREEISQQERKLAADKNRLRKFMMRYSWFRRLFLSRNKKQGFPYWCSKSDEERLQNFPYVLEQFKDKEVYITEKIDYCSGTFTGKLVPRFNSWFGIRMFNLINKL